eukprot:6204570-Lingulodinium_polyedra.AAC.1
MAMFHTAIAKSQQREAQMSNEAHEDRLKYDEEITKLHAQLEATEKLSMDRLGQLVQWEEWEWERAAAAAPAPFPAN